MKLTTSIDINAPLAETYQVFSDIAAVEDRIKNIETIEMLAEPETFVGTRWKETRSEFGKRETVEMWVSKAEEDTFYEVTSQTHGVDYWSRYDFEKLDENTTRVTLTFTGVAKTFGSKFAMLLMPLFIGATKKLFLKDMQDLKRVLEQSQSNETA